MQRRTIPLFAVMALAAWTSCAHGSPLSPDQDADPVVADFVERLNRERRDAGCAALAWDDDVARVARAHSADMVRRDFFSHSNPDGDDPFERLASAKIAYRSAAENILQGATTGLAALDLWMGSPGHRANLMNCGMTHHGVGRVDDYWTHVFIRKAG
jgi:uncharacterized protein YkwD